MLSYDQLIELGFSPEEAKSYAGEKSSSNAQSLTKAQLTELGFSPEEQKKYFKNSAPTQPLSVPEKLAQVPLGVAEAITSIPPLLADAKDFAGEKIAEYLPSLANAGEWFNQKIAEYYPEYAKRAQEKQDLQRQFFNALNEKVQGTLPPQTLTEKALRLTGEFLPVGPGIASKLGNVGKAALARKGVADAVKSLTPTLGEAAQVAIPVGAGTAAWELTDKNDAITGLVAGGAGLGTLAGRILTSGDLVKSIANLNPGQKAQIQNLMQMAKDKGVPLTFAEAYDSTVGKTSGANLVNLQNKNLDDQRNFSLAQTAFKGRDENKAKAFQDLKKSIAPDALSSTDYSILSAGAGKNFAENISEMQDARKLEIQAEQAQEELNLIKQSILSENADIFNKQFPRQDEWDIGAQLQEKIKDDILNQKNIFSQNTNRAYDIFRQAPTDQNEIADLFLSNPKLEQELEQVKKYQAGADYPLSFLAPPKDIASVSQEYPTNAGLLEIKKNLDKKISWTDDHNQKQIILDQKNAITDYLNQIPEYSDASKNYANQSSLYLTTVPQNYENTVKLNKYGDVTAPTPSVYPELSAGGNDAFTAAKRADEQLTNDLVKQVYRSKFLQSPVYGETPENLISAEINAKAIENVPDMFLNLFNPLVEQATKGQQAIKTGAENVESSKNLAKEALDTAEDNLPPWVKNPAKELNVSENSNYVPDVLNAYENYNPNLVPTALVNALGNTADVFAKNYDDLTTRQNIQNLYRQAGRDVGDVSALGDVLTALKSDQSNVLRQRDPYIFDKRAQLKNLINAVSPNTQNETLFSIDPNLDFSRLLIDKNKPVMDILKQYAINRENEY
jgi:hypothetical protein